MEDQAEPSLLVISEKGQHFSASERARLQEGISRLSCNGGVFVAESGMRIYQRVNGKWEPLTDPAPKRSLWSRLRGWLGC